MRRLALLAAALAVACSSKKESDTTPPAVPVISAPAAGATIGSGALVGGQVPFSGTAEAGATVEVQVGGAVVATTTASGGGTWTAHANVSDGTRTAQARAIDGAGNASALCAPVAFTVDTLAPAAPVLLAPQDGAALEWSDLRWPGGEVVFTGTAEPGSTVEVDVTGPAAGTATAVAAADGTWSVGLALDGGSYTVRARAIDGALNASAYGGPIAFTLDRTMTAQPLPVGWPYVSVTSWGQTTPVTAADASGLGELFPGQANSWVLDRDFSLGAGYGLQYSNALVLYSGVPTSPTSHASLLTDLLGNAFRAFPGDQAFSEATFLSPTLSADGGLRAWAIDHGASMGVPAIAGNSAYLNGTASSVLGGYLLEFAPGETYTFGWTHQAVLDGGRLAGADAAPYAPSYQVVLRTPSSPMQVIGEPLFSSTTNVLRATESVTRSGLPQYAVLQFELRSAAPGYAEFDALTLSDSTGPVALRNPDFESGADGWATALSGGGSQNVRSGARAVGGAGSSLRVTRTFHAPVTATWGRMVDVFENTGATDVTTTIVANF
jgi:hypothetical protein